tara:strand:- start:598 stop:972 length:375 start_codon:yes stop_codon:yes gene_type:complete
MKIFVSILLAFLVLVSTAGVGISKHLCDDLPVLMCTQQKGGECACANMHAEDERCLSDREFFQVDDDFVATSGEKLNFFKATIFSVSVYHLSFDLSDGDRVAFCRYIAPLPDKDIPVLFQSLLI